MTSLFNRLGYDFNDPNSDIITFSTEVVEQMNSMPQFLTDWQKQDMVNNDVDGYFVNKVSGVTQNIITIANDILNVSNNITSNNANTLFESVKLYCNNIVSLTGPNFIAHTDRISGVVEITPETALLPHYETALSISKTLVILTYQTDGVQNNAPIMGNFTSLLIEPQLNNYYLTIQPYPEMIQNSINITSTTDEQGNTIYSNTSNLSAEIIQTMYNNCSGISNLFDTRRIHDENFYTNASNLMNDFKDVIKFNNMGITQTDLLANYVGSDKLLQRIT